MSRWSAGSTTPGSPGSQVVQQPRGGAYGGRGAVVSAAVPHADVDGHRIHYVRQGSGEPLLLIQGLSGNHLHWRDEFLGLLDDDFELIALDNRGIGHSSRTSQPFTVADMADDAVGLLGA